MTAINNPGRGRGREIGTLEFLQLPVPCRWLVGQILVLHDAEEGKKDERQFAKCGSFSQS